MFVVGRFAAYQASQGDDGIVFAGFCQSARLGWNLEGARYPNGRNVFIAATGAPQSVDGSLQQALGNKRIPATHDDSKPHSLRIQLALDGIFTWLQGLPESNLQTLGRPGNQSARAPARIFDIGEQFDPVLFQKIADGIQVGPLDP